MPPSPLRAIRQQILSVPVLGDALRSAKSVVQSALGVKAVDYRTQLLSKMPQHARCAELGVWKGDFSARILKATQPSLLVLVDPWKYAPEYSQRMYGGTVAKNQSDMDGIYQSVLSRFEHEPAVQIERQRSVEFLSSTQLVFDWIYIDGDHSEEPVYRDLGLAWRRVVKGGLVTGDDYFWRDSDQSLPVKNAVVRFCSDHGCSAEIIGGQFIIRRV